MKKICVLVLVQLLLGTACYGAVSEDIYVRKDVFEANMQGINTKLDILLEQMKEFKAEMKAQREEHNIQMKELRNEMKEFKEEQRTQNAELREEMKAQNSELREEMKAQGAELREKMALQREEHKAQMKELQDEMKATRADIAELTRVVSVLSERVDRNFDTLSARIDGVDGQIGGLRNGIYLGLVVLGIVLGMPAVQKMFQSWAERKPSLTVDDVKRLIDEAISRYAASSSGN